MAERVTVAAELRKETGRQALVALRRAGKVPAILYGGSGQTIPLQVNPRELAHVLGAQHHSLFQLQVQGGEETLAMITETQWEPMRGSVQHVDFKRVLMDRKIRVAVPIVPEGEARGIKEQGGVFEVVLREVDVECLPADLPEEIRLQVSELMLGQQIRVADAQKQVGERVRILREPQGVICHVVTPKAVEEEKPAEVAVAEAPAEPEVIKKGKVAEEGEEPAAEAAPSKKEAAGRKEK
jgi:large subunit ribosomal protein L25